VVAQVGPKIGVPVVHINVDDLKAGKHKEWAPLMQSRSITYTVLVDSKKSAIKTWNGAYDGNEFAKMVKAAIPK